MQPPAVAPLHQHWIDCVYPRTLKIVQWNTLAQSLATPDAFPHVESPEITLSWEHRFALQREHVARVDPDIIAFEELDRYPEWKAHLDATHDSVWEKKRSADSLDGTAVFWRRSILAPSREHEVLHFTDSSQIAVLVHLIFAGSPLTVAAVHLKAKPEFADMRMRQAGELLHHLLDTRVLPTQNLVVLGDFNDVPGSRAVSVFDNYTPLGLTSAYEWAPPLFTTFKVRDETVIRVIDYILCSPHLRVRSVLELPRPEEMAPTGLPSLAYGSDHLMLGAELEFPR